MALHRTLDRVVILMSRVVERSSPPMKTTLWVVTAAAVLFLSGCGGVIGSCTETGGAATVCVDYEQSPGGAADLEQSCESGGGGTWSTNACTATSRVGRCKTSISVLGVSSVSTTHYYAPMTTAQAEDACDSFSGTGITMTFTPN